VSEVTEVIYCCWYCLCFVTYRPAWDSSTTPEELDKMERESFLEWRRALAV